MLSHIWGIFSSISFSFVPPPNPSLEAQKDLGLEAGRASRLGFEGGGTEEKMEEEKEKIPYICESIGHRPL